MERWATYATKLLKSGVDLKTFAETLRAQKNLESTVRYLTKVQSHEVSAKVDAIWDRA
jgi:site-specific recombinase XerD